MRLIKVFEAIHDDKRILDQKVSVIAFWCLSLVLLFSIIYVIGSLNKVVDLQYSIRTFTNESLEVKFTVVRIYGNRASISIYRLYVEGKLFQTSASNFMEGDSVVYRFQNTTNLESYMTLEFVLEITDSYQSSEVLCEKRFDVELGEKTR